MLFCLLVLTDLLQNIFFLAKYLPWLFRPRNCHTRSTRPFQGERKDPLFPGARQSPWNVLSLAAATHLGAIVYFFFFFLPSFATTFFPLNNRWLHSFYFQKLENEACLAIPFLTHCGLKFKPHELSGVGVPGAGRSERARRPWVKRGREGAAQG